MSPAIDATDIVDGDGRIPPISDLAASSASGHSALYQPREASACVWRGAAKVSPSASSASTKMEHRTRVPRADRLAEARVTIWPDDTSGGPVLATNPRFTTKSKAATGFRPLHRRTTKISAGRQSGISNALGFRGPLPWR